MEPKEEQDAELEALEAIFDTDFRLTDEGSSNGGARFEIQLADDAAGEIKLRLIFTHTKDYPTEPLILVVHALEGLSTPRRKDLQLYLEGVAKENADMPAVFAICEAAREWLTENVVGKPSDPDEDEESSAKFETLDATQLDKVEVISSKAIGNPVTVESFAAWRAKFEQELSSQKTKEQIERESITKMTGREMFESKVAVISAESESFWEAEAEVA